MHVENIWLRVTIQEKFKYDDKIKQLTVHGESKRLIEGKKILWKKTD